MALRPRHLAGVESLHLAKWTPINQQTLNTEENDFRGKMLQLVEMAKVTRKQYVSNAESGPSIVRSTPLDDTCGASMANIQARQYILLKTVPNMRYWLYFRPDNWNPKTTVDWGMWEKENPRQVVSAFAATARLMAFAEFVRELPLHQDIPCWMFRKDGKYFATLWYNGKNNLKVTLPAGIPVDARDVQGNPIKLKGRNLMLGEAPVYLYAENPEVLEKLLANAADGVSELAFVLERQIAGKTILMVKNQSGRVMDLKLKGVDFSGTGVQGTKSIAYNEHYTLASGELKTIEKPVGAENVTFHLETSKGCSYEASATLKPVIVPHVKDFSELEKKATLLRLDEPAKQISAYDDLKVHGLYTGLDDLSAVFRLGYDKQYLYLEVQVKDDVHLNDNVPGKIYNGDSVQFAIDTRRDAKMKLMRGIRNYSDDDFNFVSALASGESRTRCFVAPSAKRADLLEKNYALQPEIIRNETAKITIYRIKLALSDLAPLKAESGMNFGFSLHVFDMDTPSSFYGMGYSQGVCQPYNPAEYPAFQFE